jgi:tRNA1(Val) A37 N6-methylase TrmN6
MKELLRTNDTVRISWLTSVLSGKGIEAVVLDTHTSIPEEQIGAIPRRVMVLNEDFEEAQALIVSTASDLFETDTADTILGGKVALAQPSEGYRVAIDPVLLAASVPELEKGRILDVGTGVGAAALCYAWRSPRAEVVGLELQLPLCKMATGNAARNGLQDHVRFVCGDLLCPPSVIAEDDFDHVMANPPYLPQNRADPKISDAKALSNVEGEAGLTEWIEFCLRIAAPNGAITMIHRADRLDEILTALHDRAGGIVVFPLWPKREVSPKRVIVRARTGSKAPLRISPGLVLHEKDGEYTEKASNILLDGAAIDL